jgi:hypothetical protein
VHGPVPEVDTGFVNQHADDGATPATETAEVEELELREPFTPQQRQIRRQHHVGQEGREAAPLPALDVGQHPCGHDGFETDQAAVNGEHGKRDRIEQDVDRAGHGGILVGLCFAGWKA